MWLPVLMFWSLGLWAAVEPPKGQLCVAGQACRDYSCGQPLEASERTFQLTTATPATRYFGVLRAGETTIACSGYAALELKITAPKFSRTGSARVVLTNQTDHAWVFVLQAADLRSAVSVRLPKGSWTIAVESPHYRKLRRTVIAGEKPEALALALEPLPIVSGRVFERGTPHGVGGAVLTTNVGTSAIADGSGLFTIEADPDQWPATMAITAAGYGEATLAVPKSRASVTLDDAFLSRGGAIAVEAIPSPSAEVTAIELRKLPRGAMYATPFKRIPVSAAGPATARFTDLEDGRYVVLTTGAGPLEQRGEPVELTAGEEKSLQLRIAPIRVHFRARMGGEPLTGAGIAFRSKDGSWSGKIETDEQGEATTMLWQAGRASAWITPNGVINAPDFDDRTIPDGEEFEWILDVPTRQIRGVIVDARSGKAVPNAVIGLKVVQGGKSFAVRTRSDAEGRFQFMPVPYGAHTIVAASATHLQAETTYTFSPPEELRELTIRLDSGAVVRLRVTDAAGAPVVRAVAMQYRGLIQTRLSATDESGVAEIIVAEGETRDVYVIPRDGSFGITRLGSSPPERSLRLPAGNGRIELRTESEARQPIADVSVAMRYNGQLLPPEVVRDFGRLQGARTSSRADGRIVFDHMPAGIYEFWPAGSAAELQMIAAGVGPRAPVSMKVAPGANVAFLTFAPVPTRP